ncbi:hypothetical protein OPT61_g4972 [Boeremia exigua]|uniref:Uncharacterized protein n=1 Tax=Boeremia exigua TaxID=749465 RepID=A0ACC2IBZ6_9PLEO|nr:hypothetical protein OPT61_g4972 [Boeremia exigua]
MASNGSATGSHNIASPANRSAQGQWTPGLDASLREREASTLPTKSASYVPPEYFPNGKRSLAGIGLRAFFLGNAAVAGFFFAAQLAYHGSHLWRPALFLGTLSVFHFLEFYTTAAYNTPDAKISSFLLTNGAQYRVAHTMAFVETVVTSYFFPAWQLKVHPPMAILMGIIMVLMGQVVRSTAMAQAGTNFNHQVQSKKIDGHELVTRGLYAHFRHPSYFGFFWWGIGTQVMIGNTICTLGYAGVLWYFFMKRINHEEKHLVQFFGKDYETYRSTTRSRDLGRGVDSARPKLCAAAAPSSPYKCRARSIEQFILLRIRARRSFLICLQ